MSFPASGVGHVIGRGALSASEMGQAQAPSAFDVWTHSYDGMADRMRAAASDPVAFLAADPAQRARIDAAMVPGQWASSSIDRVVDSIAAQASALGDGVQAMQQAQGALQTVGATFALLTGVEQMISSVLSVIPFPAFPAVRISDMDIGLPHGHMHPPNLVPPAPMVPLPSTGPVIPIPILSGATQTLINGMPAARCGDMGLGVWCGGYFPMYEIFLGSSSVWIEGCRAARVLVDITKHCIFTSPKPQDRPLGPMVGTTISSSANVMIGGVPMPSLLALGIGAALKGLGALLGKGARVFSRLTAPLRRRLGRGLNPGFLKCTILRAEPVNLITGEVQVDQQDYEIPGYMPLEWSRHYGSQNGRRGVCGNGWSTPADARVVLEEDGALVFYDGADNPVVFPHLPLAGPVRDFVHGATLAADGQRVSVRLKFGHTYHFPRPDAAYPETVVAYVEDRCGNYVQYSHDEHGLREIVEQAGRRIEVQSRNGLVHEMRLRHPDYDESRLLVRYEYGAAGELLAVYDALGHPYRFRYDRGRLAQHTDRTGLSFYYEYDSESLTARCCHTYGDGSLYDYRFERDPVTRRVTVTDSLGAASVIQLNELNLPTRETDAAGGVTHYHYDSVGRTVAVIDPLSRRAEYDYDDDGNRVREVRPDGAEYTGAYDENGLLTRTTDPLGHSWHLRWDSRGLLQERVSPRGAVWKYSYDPHGALASLTDPLGRVLRHGMDAFGNLTSSNDGSETFTFVTDLLGNVVSASNAEGQHATYRYDPSGLLLSVTTRSSVTVSFGYDTESRMTEYRDAAGYVMRVRYTGLGEVAEVQHLDGSRVQYEYDTEERLTRLINERGQHFDFRYDVLGRLTDEIDYWGNVRHYRYDPAGALIESSDPLGRVIKYKRDAVGRLLSKRVAEGEPSDYRYDLVGNLVAFKNRSATVTREFDDNNALVREVQGDFQVDYAYDLCGNCVRRSSSHGNDVRFAYDPGGRVNRFLLNGQQIGLMQRDSSGRVTRETLKHALTRSSTFNEDGDVTVQSLARDRSTLLERSYKYDVRGNLIERQSSTGGSERFAYDALGRITRHLDASGQAASFAYDAAGNLLLEQPGADANVAPRRMSLDGMDYSFDACGNLVEREDGQGRVVLGWSQENRLVHAETGSGRTTYQYDAIGRRLLKRSDASSEVHFQWDGDRLLSERSDTGRLLEFIFYPRSFVPFAAVDEDKRVFYFQTDNVGLPHELVDEDGRIVWSARYGAFGETKSSRGTVTTNPIRFPNQYYDEETGLSYTRYRYYDPRAKAFISQDPLGPLAGCNVYDYGLNPWAWVDPYGLVCLDNNLLSQAQEGNPATIAFLRANAGNLRFGRATRNEFLKRYSQRELSQLSDNFGLIFDETGSYRNVMNDATDLRGRFAGTNPRRRLRLMDSRQAAEAQQMGETLLTNDQQLYKRATDLGVPVQYVDSFPGPGATQSNAARNAANYVRDPV